VNAPAIGFGTQIMSSCFSNRQNIEK